MYAWWQAKSKQVRATGLQVGREKGWETKRLGIVRDARVQKGS